MKPSDAFLGAIDFFSTLVPGAVAAFLLLSQNKLLIPLPSGLQIPSGPAEQWSAFLVAAFLLGHAIAAVGSILLDSPLYDRVYMCWKRTEPATPARGWLLSAPRRAVLKDRALKVYKKKIPDDPLLAAAKMLKRRQLQTVLQGPAPAPDDISNTFWWAGTVVRLRSADGKAEIESLQAQSKLFRSMVVILLLMAAWWPFASAGHVCTWVALLWLSAWRFCKLRWDSTERTYEYYLALAVNDGPLPEIAPAPPT